MIQIKYLMTIFLSVLFSDLLLSNKGLESHDSPNLVDADINNFFSCSILFACFCSLQAVRNSAEANPANPNTMRPIPINACHGRRYFCTSQSTMTDVGIPSIVPTLQHYYIQHGKFSQLSFLKWIQTLQLVGNLLKEIVGAGKSTYSRSQSSI